MRARAEVAGQDTGAPERHLKPNCPVQPQMVRA
jgi:hypothetical protein